jgi:ribosomal protein S18 acetylase RimI-like enzyme
MAVALSAVPGRPNPGGLDLEAVATEDGLVDWLNAFARSFGREPRGREHPWFLPFAHLGLVEDGPYRFVVGRVDGVPVACSLGFIGAAAVGIYGVGTVPEFRGRGYGSAVTLAAMELGPRPGSGAGHPARDRDGRARLPPARF